MFKRPIKITRIKKEGIFEVEDVVLVERPIDLYVNSEPLVNIICLPKDLEELAVGFLFSIGLINAHGDIKELIINELEQSIHVELKESIDFNVESLEINPVSRVIDTTCGISSSWRNLIKKALKAADSTKASETDFRISKNVIFQAIKEMQVNTTLFKETGGCHGAAIFTREGKLLSCKEDIGRHNAIDKVIGEMVMKKIDLKDVFLTSTGRLTGDSVLKSVRAQIPIVASLSAAIESGIRLAFGYGITLIGFVRGSRMNIYCHPERISDS